MLVLAAWAVPVALPVALITTVPGCRKASPRQEREVDHGLVRLHTSRMHLRHDRVGHDQWASQAAFVLLDAENTHSEDLMVTLGGELLAAGGGRAGVLRPESLRIPAGGVRTFALIDRENRDRPDAVSASVRVMGAYVPTYVPPIQITDGNVFQDGDRVVVAGMVQNAVDRPVRVLIIAGFYDRDGKPLTRPFTQMSLLEDESHPARFVGPPGSVAGYIFVGDFVY